MNYSTIHTTSIIKQKIFIDKKSIFIVLPDTNLDISTEIYNANFLLSNCIGLVCPNKVLTIGKRKFNGKAHFFDVKKKLAAIDHKIGRKIRVLNSLVVEKPDKEVLSSHKTSNYYFYDATVWSQALNFMLQRFPERTVAKQLLEELSSLYKQIKSSNQEYNVEVLFLIKNQGGQLYNILTNIRAWMKKDELKPLKFFDDFAIISDCQNVVFPIFNSEEAETKLIITNLPKLEQYIEVNTTVDDINKLKESPIASEGEEDHIATLNLPGATEVKSEKELPSYFDNFPFWPPIK